MDLEGESIIDTMNELGRVFDELCQERHNLGEEKYGSFTWMGNDVVRMMVEELADTANYCRYQAIKLMLLQAAMEEKLADFIPDGQEEITIGVKAFKGTKEGWRK